MDFSPASLRLRVTNSTRRLTRAALTEIDHVIVVMPRRIRPREIEALPFGDTIRTLRDRAQDKNALLQGIVLASRQVGITALTTPVDDSAFALLSLARRGIGAVLAANPARVAIYAAHETEHECAKIMDAFVRAAFASCAAMPSYKSIRTAKPRLRALTLFTQTAPNVERLRIEAEANHLARWLTNQPPNFLDARSLVAGAVELAQNAGYEHRILDEHELTAIGAHAFLAVARANEHSHAAIVHLRRRGSGKHIALVGKGVCYDTGGINLKPANAMYGMHEDMQGSAVALASFIALSKLDESLDLECWLAVTENRMGSDAYTPNEIVTALNGHTIEIVHSDAEGRMALADTLTLASRNKPELIIDYATLTGACVGALTTGYTGAFTNREALHSDLIGAGRDSGERVWPFPLDSDFDKAIESQWADVKQCAVSGRGDHIHAARFLLRFIESDVPWVHFDLSAGNHKGGLAHIPTDVTGFGVHVTAAFILDRPALESLG